MTKEEYLAIAESRYEALKELGKLDNFYDCEKNFDAIWQDLGRTYLERSLQEKTSNSKDRRKKKTLTKFGEITLSKSHNYMKDSKNGFGISPLMQELMTYAGHLDCYAKSDEILNRFLSVEVSVSQVYRVTNSVSKRLREEENDGERLLAAVSKAEVLYVEADGSMISTREEGWKEVKLARLFKSSDCLNPNTESACLQQSQYVAHFGNCRDFCEKVENVIDSYGRLKSRLVFITDGATWIKNWIEDSYSESTAILDYYHACEHLHDFVENAMNEDREKRKQWFEEQKELLLESRVDQVIKNIKRAKAKSSEKEKLLNYYQVNKERMDYHSYRQLGCGIIGSGAIESAHRTVIQRRMKLSGQHWSREGVNNMLRLRVFSMNKQWCKVINLLRKTAYMAA